MASAGSMYGLTLGGLLTVRGSSAIFDWFIALTLVSVLVFVVLLDCVVVVFVLEHDVPTKIRTMTVSKWFVFMDFMVWFCDCGICVLVIDTIKQNKKTHLFGVSLECVRSTFECVNLPFHLITILIVGKPLANLFAILKLAFYAGLTVFVVGNPLTI